MSSSPYSSSNPSFGCAAIALVAMPSKYCRKDSDASLDRGSYWSEIAIVFADSAATFFDFDTFNDAFFFIYSLNY